MKRILFLTFSLLSFILHSEAKQVKQERAFSIAQKVLLSPVELRSGDDNSLQLTQTVYNDSRSLRSSDIVLYYVYNRKEGGYIIIAGDDLVHPIIGYSFSGRYNPDNLPPNLKLWMEDVAYGISNAINENESSSIKNSSEWERYFNGTINLRSTQAEPLISTRWGQGTPYNLLCPMDGNEKTLTGCVATVMAQIMNYHQYPSGNLIGTIPGYTTKNKKHIIPAINLTGQSYNWALLQSGSQSTEFANEVAKLMYHCGVSVEMDYETAGIGSGAVSVDMVKAFYTYFGYDKGIQTKRKDYYSSSAWTNMLKVEIDNGRPLVYSGTTDRNEGHAFICDGYNTEDYFHFNWGWDGASDGFFSIDNYGANAIKYVNYTEIQIGIQPEKGGELSFEIVVGGNDPKDSSISTDTKQVNQGVDFSITGSFLNLGPKTFRGNLGFLLLNEDNSPIAVLGGGYAGENGLIPGRYMKGTIPTCSVPASIPDGNYFIKAAVQEAGSSYWQIIKVAIGKEDKLPLQVGSGISAIDHLSLVSVYVNGNDIFIKSNEEETVQFFSILGSSLTQVKKPVGEIRISIESIPNGVLIVKGTSGWTRKILIK